MQCLTLIIIPIISEKISTSNLDITLQFHVNTKHLLLYERLLNDSGAENEV